MPPLSVRNAPHTPPNFLVEAFPISYSKIEEERKTLKSTLDVDLNLSQHLMSTSQVNISCQHLMSIFQLDFPFLMPSISQYLEFIIYNCYFWVGFPVSAVKYFSIFQIVHLWLLFLGFGILVLGLGTLSLRHTCKNYSKTTSTVCRFQNRELQLTFSSSMCLLVKLAITSLCMRVDHGTWLPSQNLAIAAMAEKLSEKLHLHCTGYNIYLDWYGMLSSLCSLATNGIIFQALFSRFSITHPSSSTTTFSFLRELYLLKQLLSGCTYCRTQAHRLYIFL